MSQLNSARTLVFVGTYTRPEAHVKAASGKGIYIYELNRASGALTFLSLADNIDSPTFLALAPDGRQLYAASEVSKLPEGDLVAYAIDAGAGTLAYINKQPTHGGSPAYVSVEHSGRYAFAANYGGSKSVAMFPIRADGGLEPACDTVQHHGSGVNAERQDGPHPHCAVIDPSNTFLLVADLGIDRILCYRIDFEAGRLVASDPPGVSIEPGAGPRHLAFHPNGRFLYLISELKSTVTALTFDSASGRMNVLQTIPMLPEGFSGQSHGAEIKVHPSGRFVYASNRGHDSIVAYAVDPQTGALSHIGHQSTKGQTPRNFNIDPGGAFLLAANQDSGTIATFRIDPDSGALVDTGIITESPTPVCIQMLEV